MRRQLKLEFDQEKLKILKSIFGTVDQREVIQGLIELYLQFIQIEEKGGDKECRK